MLDRSPRPARFFFCDDNVGRDNASLRQMLDLFAAHQVPIDLGLTREFREKTPAKELRIRLASSSGRIGLHRHGFSHGDRRPDLRPAGEVRPSRIRAIRTSASVAQEVEPNLRPVANSTATVLSMTAPRFPQVPVSVDWCSHRAADTATSRNHLGRLIAVAASRHQPVGIILDHTRISGNEFREIEELLVLLANHRKVECLLMRQLAGLPSANDDGMDAPVKSPPADPATGLRATLGRWTIDAVRLLRDRIKRPDVKYRWLILAACLVAAAFIGWHWLGESGSTARFLTAPVGRGDIENTVLSAGTVQPYEYVDVGAQTSGQLKSLKVQLGDKVTKGQLLAEIDSVISASKVAEAEATLAGLKAQRAAKKEKLALALLQKSRSEELQRQGAQAASDGEIAESNYKLAREGLALLDAQMTQARAALQTARANLDYTRITAPMAGEVVAISAREGQTLNASQQAPTLLRIAALDTMTVWALVPEADVSRLRLGQDVYFTVLGQSERRWHSRLRQILPSPEIVANVIFYNALFDVPNPLRDLKVQMTAQVFFVLDQAKNALYVPLSALTAAKSGKADHYVVRRLGANGQIEHRPVRVGITNAISAQILAGLDEGDTVIVGEADTKQGNVRSRPIRSVGPR
jgi:macrolide-specific efflux system membrane fusion protein